MKRAHSPATRRSEERRLGDRCRRPIENQELLLDENGLGDERTDAARTQEAGERSDDMNKKDDEIAHLTILPRTANPQELCATTNSP